MVAKPYKLLAIRIQVGNRVAIRSDDLSIGVERLDQISGFSVYHRFAYTSEVRRDDGQACRQCLQYNIGKAVVGGGIDQRVVSLMINIFERLILSAVSQIRPPGKLLRVERVNSRCAINIY